MRNSARPMHFGSLGYGDAPGALGLIVAICFVALACACGLIYALAG